jgi:cation diffusion facilitator CzcD-associated flavoprotein CzcO
MVVALYDEAPTGLEGPWATTARMETLRSPKQLAGPALGLPSLTVRAWFEAQFGAAAWEALDKIPRLQWMDYLRWYRRVMSLDVRNATTVAAVLPRADGRVLLQLRTPAGPSQVLARRVAARVGGHDALA